MKKLSIDPGKKKKVDGYNDQVQPQPILNQQDNNITNAETEDAPPNIPSSDALPEDLGEEASEDKDLRKMMGKETPFD